MTEEAVEKSEKIILHFLFSHSSQTYIHPKLFDKLTGCKQGKTIFLNEHHGSHICNPDFNNEDCRFDGGDCCLPIIDDKYCPPRPSTACDCHEDNSRHTSFTEGMQLIYRTRAIIVLLVS